MSGNKKYTFLEIMHLALSGVAIGMAIKNLFDNDESKVVTRAGREFLDDPEKMKVLKTRLMERDTNEELAHQEIII